MTALIKYWYLVAIATLVVLLGLSQTRLSAEKASHQKTRADNAVVLQGLAEKTAAVYRAVIADQERQQKALADLDAKHTKELSDAKRKIDGDESDVRAGTRRLRVAATCPGTTTGVPPAPSATVVVDGAAPRLDDAAQRHYFDLRRAIAEATQQIAGLQSYVADVCLAKSESPASSR